MLVRRVIQIPITLARLTSYAYAQKTAGECYCLNGCRRLSGIVGPNAILISKRISKRSGVVRLQAKNTGIQRPELLTTIASAVNPLVGMTKAYQ
jgi:hypothetical protein